MPVAGAMAENATLFVVYNQSQAFLRRMFPPPPSSSASPGDPPPMSIPQTATAAALAGAAASFVLTPVELVKCKMQVSNIATETAIAAAAAGAAPPPRGAPTSATATGAASGATAAVRNASTLASAATATPQPGAIAFTRQILREYGLRGLWLGQTGTLIRETGGGAAWFLSFELLVAYFVQRRTDRGETGSGGGGSSSAGGRVTKADLSALELMSAGASAGVMYNVVLFPADCIKSTIQTEDELRGAAGKNEPRRSFFQVGKDIYRARGVRGLYSGCLLTALKAAPSSALIFYMCVQRAVFLPVDPSADNRVVHPMQLQPLGISVRLDVSHDSPHIEAPCAANPLHRLLFHTPCANNHVAISLQSPLSQSGCERRPPLAFRSGRFRSDHPRDRISF